MLAAFPARAAEPPLIAHWTFDEDLGAQSIRETSGNAAMSITIERDLTSRRGVFGNALDVRGEHALRTGGFGVPSLDTLSFSVWVRPTELSGYRELYRQECNSRVLFSFQESGAILSLGLNIGGYIECDARIDPALLRDGDWHHCGATFDGLLMRVYLDGAEVATLERPGKIALEPGCAGYIGSSNGTGEHFQGSLDDLRIYSGALTAEQIAAMHREGVASVAAFLAEMDATASALYAKADTFAETIAGTRQRLSKNVSPVGWRPRRRGGAQAARRLPRRVQPFRRVYRRGSSRLPDRARQRIQRGAGGASDSAPPRVHAADGCAMGAAVA